MVSRYSWFCVALRSSTAELGSKKKRMSRLSRASPSSDTVPPVRTGSWWQSHRRRVWLWLAFLAAVTAPLWGGLILLWLFSPSSPFPQSP